MKIHEHLARSRRQPPTIISCTMALTLLALPAVAQLPGGTLNPATLSKFVTPLYIPGVMPASGSLPAAKPRRQATQLYEIETVQVRRQVLPPGLPATTLWTYGAVGHPETRTYPAFTIEAAVDTPVRVRWINNLKDASGHFLPHLLPVDQTLHWANPGQLECSSHGGAPGNHTDCRVAHPSQERYLGPVPLVPHLHGAHVGPESDGFPAAWFLPGATDIPATFAKRGSLFRQIAGQPVQDGVAVYEYPNDQPPAGLWYHDHTLGMTHANVYAGPVGMYLLRASTDAAARLPAPAPTLGVDFNTNTTARRRLGEIPLIIQDRSFNSDGSLFYPSSRDFFEGLPNGTLSSMGVRFTPTTVSPPGAPHEHSDIAPIWQPEFFGNTMVVNGNVWPVLGVERKAYRFRVLNGSNSRFLILRFPDEAVSFLQVGADQGFLPRPVVQERLLLAPSERADVVVDFSRVRAGTRLVLQNIGPDEPYGGGVPCLTPGSTPGDGTCDFAPSDPATTGNVMAFDVTAAATSATTSTADVTATADVAALLPAETTALTPTVTRRISLNEMMSMTEQICVDAAGELITLPGTANDPIACAAAGGSLSALGPAAAMLGTVDQGNGSPRMWGDAVTEHPALNATETWEIYNYTADAHPVHLHLVRFKVVNRQALVTDAEGVAVQPAQLIAGQVTPPAASETGFKDTVIAYPGQVTRIMARFDREGLYVWHCHILEHEDNEMMRPYCVGAPAACPLPIQP